MRTLAGYHCRRAESNKPEKKKSLRAAHLASYVYCLCKIILNYAVNLTETQLGQTISANLHIARKTVDVVLVTARGRT